MKPELRKIARCFNHSVDMFNSYDVNRYRFQTHKYTTSRPSMKTINSGGYVKVMMDSITMEESRVYMR
jgi:hypothetical protein